MAPQHRLVLNGISKSISAEQLSQALAKYGEIVSYERPLMPDGSDGNECYVMFQDDRMAALLLGDGYLSINDINITVRYHDNIRPASKNLECKVYVRDLTPDLTPRILTNYFRGFGTVKSVTVEEEKNSGIIVFEHIDALRAISDLGSHLVENTVITTEFNEDVCGQVFVGGLNERSEKKKVLEQLEDFGYILKWNRPEKDGQAATYAFVTYSTQAEADAAIKAGEIIVRGRRMQLKAPKHRQNSCLVESQVKTMLKEDLREGSFPLTKSTEYHVQVEPSSTRKRKMSSGYNVDSNMNGTIKQPRFDSEAITTECTRGSGAHPKPLPQHKSGTKVYIKNLPENFHRVSIEEVFEKYGKINMIWVKPGGGFGFVIFEEEESAWSAVALGPHVVNGQEIITELPGSVQIFVGGLNKTVNEGEVSDALEQFGMVLSWQRDSEGAYMIVTFPSQAIANKAIQAGSILLNDHPLYITPVTKHLLNNKY